MTSPATNGKSTLGFLTAVEHPEHGLFGGYLILNMTGRPLEFHCTLPIKPNRAQEILYGPTLDAFLYGEQIGQTLLGEGKTRPLAVFTDRAPMMAVREFASMPTALVLANGDCPAGLTAFEFGRNRLGVAPSAADDRRAMSERLGELRDSFDLAEPFERVHAAIEEAQKAAR